MACKLFQNKHLLNVLERRVSESESKFFNPLLLVPFVFMVFDGTVRLPGSSRDIVQGITQ